MAGNGYASTYAYDKGGNLLTLTRRNTQGSVIDNLSYAYPRNTDGSLSSNRLRAVSDAATAQGLEAGRHNFGYDALGRLTSDSLQNLTLAWTLDSKPRAATTGSTTTRYLYDSDGNRIARKTSRSGATADTTWLYLRSGEGAELALLYRIHRTDSTLITLQEATIGSAKRLGLFRSPTLLAKSMAATAHPAYLAATTTDTVQTSGRYPGYRSYQLEDHLGNVRVVVGDNKAADTSSGGLYLASRVLSASEYFPFGMTARQQTGTVAWAGGKYRWGFNGKELDRALGSNDAQDYGFRAYRPEIARFMSVDPLREKYPELTTYQFAGNMPIRYVDLDGLEPAEPGSEPGETRVASVQNPGYCNDGESQTWGWDGKNWLPQYGEATVTGERPLTARKIAEGVGTYIESVSPEWMNREGSSDQYLGGQINLSDWTGLEEIGGEMNEAGGNITKDGIVVTAVPGAQEVGGVAIATGTIIGAFGSGMKAFGRFGQGKIGGGMRAAVSGAFAVGVGEIPAVKASLKPLPKFFKESILDELSDSFSEVVDPENEPTK